MTFTVYSKPSCPNCVRAKSLLSNKGLEYVEMVMDVGQEKEEGVTYYDVQDLKNKAPTAKMLPVIFQDDALVGSYAELAKLIS